MRDAAPIVWQPSPAEIEARNLTAFAERVRRELGRDFGRDYQALWRWSVTRKDEFWPAFWRYLDIPYDGALEPVLLDADAMPGARWFPEARLNYAEAVLRWPDDAPAIVFRNEAGARRALSFGELRAEVSRVQQALADAGVGPGTRVAAIMPNVPEAIAAMLGATSLGAVWASVSPDFGVDGIVDRLDQVRPEILFVADGYHFAGSPRHVTDKLVEVARRLAGVRRVVALAYLADTIDLSGFADAADWRDFLAPYAPRPLACERLPFDHPLFILFTSGTTGPPKCIVHGAGGSFLKCMVDHALQYDLRPGDTAFFPTTLGWMMWNYLVNFMATGARVLVYDGAPAHPDLAQLYRLAAEERVSLFGLSSAFFETCRKAGLKPKEMFDLSAVRMLLAGATVCPPESFDYVYADVCPHAPLVSATGGTDLMGCFIASDPWGPVRRGELQAATLGMDVAIFDDNGEPVTGRKGELVCRSPFPSMPLGFLGDAAGRRYREAYFERFPGVWAHGDFAEQTPSGGFIVYGRSDATLNPGGVRIGTAEIYRQVDRVTEIAESVVVGQRWQNDVRIVLFVKPKDGVTLDDALAEKIRGTIRAGASPRHVPRKILAVPDIPKTRTGKVAELAVRDVVNGEAVRNREALANPDALAAFADRPELRDSS